MKSEELSQKLIKIRKKLSSSKKIFHLRKVIQIWLLDFDVLSLTWVRALIDLAFAQCTDLIRLI